MLQEKVKYISITFFVCTQKKKLFLQQRAIFHCYSCMFLHFFQWHTISRIAGNTISPPSSSSCNTCTCYFESQSFDVCSCFIYIFTVILDYISPIHSESHQSIFWRNISILKLLSKTLFSLSLQALSMTDLSKHK